MIELAIDGFYPHGLRADARVGRASAWSAARPLGDRTR